MLRGESLSASYGMLDQWDSLTIMLEKNSRYLTNKLKHYLIWHYLVLSKSLILKRIKFKKGKIKEKNNKKKKL